MPAPPKPPAPPKEPAPTAAIPRNNGKSPIQTLTPSGGIDE
jgi:penicillin-binding protein 2